MVFKALSVQQPSAYFILCGEKKIENRSIRTTHRGPLVIHAGRNKTVMNQYKREYAKELLPDELFSYGCLIGVADLVSVEEMNVDLEEDFWARGPYCWMLENPRMFRTPIPSSGKLGVYKLTEEESRKVEGQIADAEEIDIHPGMKELVEIWKEERYQEDLAFWEERVRIGLEEFESKPDDGEAAFDIGFAYGHLGDNNNALKYFSEAIRLNPKMGDAYFFRAIIRRDLGDLAGFEMDKKKALELDPDLTEESFE